MYKIIGENMINDTIKRLIVDIEPALHSKIKVMSARKGQTIKDFITAMIIKEIIKQEYHTNVDNYV